MIGHAHRAAGCGQCPASSGWTISRFARTLGSMELPRGYMVTEVTAKRVAYCRRVSVADSVLTLFPSLVQIGLRIIGYASYMCFFPKCMYAKDWVPTLGLGLRLGPNIRVLGVGSP